MAPARLTSSISAAAAYRSSGVRPSLRVPAQYLEGPVEGSRYCPFVRHVALYADNAVSGVFISEVLYDAIQFVPASSHDPDTPLLRQVSRREGETDAVRRADEKDTTHSLGISLRGSSLASGRNRMSGSRNKIEGGCIGLA